MILFPSNSLKTTYLRVMIEFSPEIYPCWSCFSLWPCFVSLRSNRDLPILQLFLPLAMLCLSPFKCRLTHAEAVSPSGHALSLSVQTETYPCCSCFSLWPCFVSLRSSVDLPVLKLFLPLAMLCLSPFKQRLTRAETVSPSGHALSLSMQTETYPCWSCFSLWPCFMSLRSSTDLPVLKLVFPLAMLCLSPFKCRLTRAEAVSPLAMLCLSPFKQRLTRAETVSPSGHALSLSMQTETYPCWSCFSLWPCFVSLRSSVDLPMLKLFLPLAMLCLSPFKQRLTHAAAVSPSGHALSLSVQV